MNFDELQSAWRDQQRQIDRVLSVQRDAVRTIAALRARSPLLRLRLGLWFELAFLVPAVLVTGAVVVGSLDAPRFLLPALALLACLGAAAFACVHQLVLARLRFDAPVVDSQRRLAALRCSITRSVHWALLLSPLLWILCLIVGVRALGGDLWAATNSAWVTGNLVFGVAAIPLLWLLCRALSRQPARRPWVQRVVRGIAGDNLAAAERELAAVAAFAAEPSGEPPAPTA